MAPWKANGYMKGCIPIMPIVDGSMPGNPPACMACTACSAAGSPMAAAANMLPAPFAMLPSSLGNMPRLAWN